MHRDAPDHPALRLLVRHSGSPKDTALAEELLGHLRPLQRFAGVDVWADDRIRAGDHARNEVDAAIEEADVALLLLSADFLASNEILDVEVPPLLERHRAGSLRVVPVVLRSCLWDALPWLAELHPLPKGGKPIASFVGDDRDRVLTEIAREITNLAAPSTPVETGEESAPHLQRAELASTLNVESSFAGEQHVDQQRRRMTILVVGSMPSHCNSRTRAGFLHAARDMGRRLAELGHELVVGSDGLTTLDRFVVEGANTASNCRASVTVCRPDDADEPQTPYAEGARDFPRIDFRYRRQEGKWPSAYSYTLSFADMAIVMGGGRHTLEASRSAQSLMKPVLAIASFGGAALDIWRTLRAWYQEQGIPDDDIALLREAWMPITLEAVVRMAKRLGTSPIRTVPTGQAAVAPLTASGLAAEPPARATAPAPPIFHINISNSNIGGFGAGNGVTVTGTVTMPASTAENPGTPEPAQHGLGRTPLATPSKPTAATPATPTAAAAEPLASVYLSYGDADLPFAQQIYKTLEAAGVPVFFRHEHAVPGAKVHRSAKRSIREYEHVILLCSERSLPASSVISELDEMLSREFDDGASERIIPVLLDDFASDGWTPRHPDIRRAVLDRVPLDMKGVDRDSGKFQKALKRLLGALRR